MTRSKSIVCAGLLAVTLAVAGCGNTRGERALSGGAIGAGVGAGAGALTGGSIGTGALIGAGAGAVTGAVTDKKDINLGD